MFVADPWALRDQVPARELLSRQALKCIAIAVEEHGPVDDVREVTLRAANRLAPGILRPDVGPKDACAGGS